MKYPALIIALLSSAIGFAQIKPELPLLTAEEAVRIALQNNYDIRISRNDLRIDQANTTIGNAGFLPVVSASISDNNSVQNSSQTRSDGTVTELDNARNSNLNYGVGLGWTIFDGFGMFARHDRLKELQKLGEAEVQLMVTNKTAEVLNTYYGIVMQQQQLVALDSTMEISRERVELAQNRYTIGKASKLEVLNAKVDLNTDQTNYLRLAEQLAATKITLNQIMARDTKTEFKVPENIDVDNSLLLNDLEESSKQRNPSLLIELINKNIAEHELRAVKAQRFPIVNVNTGYNFVETRSSLGFTTSTSAKGLNYGFTASVPIFNGFNQNRSEKVARITIENAALTIERQTQDILAQLGRSYQTYLTNIGLIEIEAGNEDIARENLSITMEKYRIGTVPTIEYRTAQLNYFNAQQRYHAARYNAKVSEIELLGLAGNLGLD